MINTSSIHDKLLQSRTMIVITGPTASGKTGLSIELASSFPIEIISADSRQIYKFMDVGTAKPTDEERANVQHHFIDILSPGEDYNAGIFGDEAEITAKGIFDRGHIPVIVGGSGLYIQSLCEGLFVQKSNEFLKNIREFLNSKLEEFGKDYLFDELQKIDPISANKYIDKNPRRVLRALEHYYAYGKPISESQSEDKTIRLFHCKYFGIAFERNNLYDRINKRTDAMWANGLAAETEKLLKMGFDKRLNSMNTVGYKEALMFLEGKYSEEKTVDEIKKNTRRYAKRQLTWFKKNEQISWIQDSHINSSNDKVLRILSELN